jgi:hypothetical protein
VLAPLLLAATLSSGAEPPEGPGLGADLPLASAAGALVASPEAGSFRVRLPADWASIEREDGTWDWSTLGGAVEAARTKGARITLVLGLDHPRHPRGESQAVAPDASWLLAWTAFSRRAVAAFPGAIATLELGRRPDLAFAPEAYAFALKTASLAARSEATSAGGRLEIAQGAVGADAIEWQRKLWALDAAPYVDVLPIEIGPDADVEVVVRTFLEESALHPPAAALQVQATGGGGPFDPLGRAVRGLASGAATAWAAIPEDEAARDAVVRSVQGLGARLRDGYQPAPLGGLALAAPEGGPFPGAAVLGRFLRSKDFTTLVVYRAPPRTEGEPQARLLIDTVDVRAPAVVDPATGTSYPTGPATVPGESRRALRVLLSEAPLAVEWQRVSQNAPGLELAPEDVEVQTSRGLTAEEIIARHQGVQKIQDDRLLRWIAAGRDDLHVKLAQGGSSLDIGIESRYFGRQGEDLEWEQLRYYVNGNLVTWKRIPEIPLLQPEKVVTLPLDLTFDKTYTYRLVGEDQVEGRPAYVLAFEPAAGAAGRSLYRGRVFVDRESFVKLKVSAVQTHLEPPVISNDETTTFAPVALPDGSTYWMPSRVDGQQLWTAAGRNFIIRRETRFSDFRINPGEEDFTRDLESAYASAHRMLRDTDQGLRYLEKEEGGGRRVKEDQDTSQLFAAAGALKDNSIDSVIPLAGVNWFDYDLFHRDIQINVFFAGVYAYANLTDPSIAGSRVDLGVEASLRALKLDDKLYVGGEEDETQRVRRWNQYLTGRVGYPLGSFGKVALIADVAWNRYDDSAEANEALDAQNDANGTTLGFALPRNHQVLAGTLQLEFNRRGYSVTAAGSLAHRSAWEPWGLFDTTTGAFEDDAFAAEQQDYATWSLIAFKEWYLPKFQKIKVELDYLGGSQLDRFSEYQFSSFAGPSLPGFSGSGVRFDEGGIGRLGWAFNIANAIRFDVDVGHARVRDTFGGQPFQDHTGVGLSFNVVGPWTTVWQGSYGRAIVSDIPALEGQQEFRVLVFKLF